ncbi:MAG: HNH endonuclease [Acidobacteria bacterium]|nr:HNH endonuclease [Acidobacteriota bacterium]
MKSLSFDLAQACRDVEDRLVPRLPLSLLERAVYYHLLRHSHLESRRRLALSMARLGRTARVSGAAARIAVHSLAQKGALRVVGVSKRGHVLELRLPGQILDAGGAPPPPKPDLDSLNFFEERELRWAIHRRDAGRCFYCRRKLNARSRMLDHVQPQAVLRCKRGGMRRMHSYRNLVSCCPACNYGKRESPAPAFLRKLYRSGHLDREEFSERLRALRSLALGKLRPVLDAPM